jgi:hypothetical protein
MVKKLIAYIEEKGTIRQRYIAQDGKGGFCYCAVGAAATLNGMDLDTWYQAYLDDYHQHSPKSYEMPFKNGCYLSDVKNGKFFKEVLDDYGLTYDQWLALQFLNDSSDFNEETRKVELVKYLSSLLPAEVSQ